MAKRTKKTKNTGSSEKENDQPTRGPHNHFQGLKGKFLHDQAEAFKEASEQGPFYTRVAQEFIQTFGYKLKYEENSPESTDLNTLKPELLDDLPKEDQGKERQDRLTYYEGLREVSIAIIWSVGHVK